MSQWLLTAPARPAARANGTVKPSDMPMTTSRTVSEPVKCCSTCGAWIDIGFASTSEKRNRLRVRRACAGSLAGVADVDSGLRGQGSGVSPERGDRTQSSELKHLGA